jgi:hypothetical protein
VPFAIVDALPDTCAAAAKMFELNMMSETSNSEWPSAASELFPLELGSTMLMPPPPPADTLNVL